LTKVITKSPVTEIQSVVGVVDKEGGGTKAGGGGCTDIPNAKTSVVSLKAQHPLQKQHQKQQLGGAGAGVGACTGGKGGKGDESGNSVEANSRTTTSSHMHDVEPKMLKGPPYICCVEGCGKSYELASGHSAHEKVVLKMFYSEV